LEDNLHLAFLILGGGPLRGGVLRGFLLPGEIGEVRKVLVLILKLDIFP
jgi:hypothetical protein